VTVANADDQYVTINFHSVDHDVRLHGMNADWWRELGPLTGCKGISGQKPEAAFQQRVILIGLSSGPCG